MNILAGDVNKNVAVFVNDLFPEFVAAIPKLESRLNHPLRVVVLIDGSLAAQGRHAPVPEGAEQIVCDFNDDTSLRAAVKSFEDNLLLVIGSAESNQPYLKRLLPFVPYTLGPTEKSLTWATHKAMMRSLMEVYRSSLVPNYQMISSAEPAELDRVLERLSLPVIMKPTGLASSILVGRAETAAQLRRHVAKSFDVLHHIYRRDAGRGQPAMIIEEFIDGDMYTIDAYVNAGGRVWTLPFVRAHTAHMLGHEGFYEFQADSHIELSDDEQAAGRSAAVAAIHALGLRSCAAHIEMFHTKDGWKIIELGPRAGGLRQDIYLAAYGIDHALNEMLVKIGLEPDVTANRRAYITSICLYPEKEGVIESIDGIEQARANPSINHLHVQGEPGDVALYSQNGGKWLVRGLLANPDLDQLYRDAAAVRSLIRITTSPQKVPA